MWHVLIMDDEPEFAFELRSWLEDRKYDVTWSRSSSEALDALDNHDIDLIITDMYVYKNGVPVSNGGISLIGELKIRTIRKFGNNVNPIPIIAMSAVVDFAGNDLVLETAQRLGADSVLSKPLDYEKLAECLRNLLTSAKV